MPARIVGMSSNPAITNQVVTLDYAWDEFSDWSDESVKMLIRDTSKDFELVIYDPKRSGSYTFNAPSSAGAYTLDVFCQVRSGSGWSFINDSRGPKYEFVVKVNTPPY